MSIQPFLLEVSPKRLGVRVVGPDDPRFEPELAEHLLPGFGGVFRAVQNFHYPRDENNIVHAVEITKVSHAETLSEISQDWFRFPTSDEWDYACAAGSRTLFRWGDHAPRGAFQDSRPNPLGGLE